MIYVFARPEDIPASLRNGNGVHISWNKESASGEPGKGQEDDSLLPDTWSDRLRNFVFAIDVVLIQ